MTEESENIHGLYFIILVLNIEGNHLFYFLFSLVLKYFSLNYFETINVHFMLYINSDNHQNCTNFHLKHPYPNLP